MWGTKVIAVWARLLLCRGTSEQARSRDVLPGIQAQGEVGCRHPLALLWMIFSVSSHPGP